MERYFKIRKNEAKNYLSFVDHISRIKGISIADISITDCVKKKILHEYPNKQGFIDLSYYFDSVNIYENRTISLQLNVIGDGETELERENNAYQKINFLSQYLLDRTDTIDISISRYGEYFFTGVPLDVQIAEKKGQEILGLLKVTYTFLVEAEAKKMIDGQFPLSIFEADGIGSFLNTFGRSWLPVYFYLKRKKPVIVYRKFDTNEELWSKTIKIEITINETIKKYIERKDIEINYGREIFSFSINSTDLKNGENNIKFRDLSTPLLKDNDYFLIIETNRI